MPTSLQLMLFFWQVGLVDTFSFIQFCINSGTQYGAIVVASAAGNFSDIGLKVLFEPIIGLGTSYQFIRAAQTEAERRARIATLAAFLSTSGASIVTLDPAECSRRWCGSIKNRIYASDTYSGWWKL